MVLDLKMTYKIEGNWKQGYALDLHTESSLFLGTDEYGHNQFQTKRTEIGELVYKLKYQSDISTLPALVNAIVGRIQDIEKFDYIIPVPPSNDSRKSQPVIQVATALGKHVDVEVLLDAVIKSKKTPELKSVTDTLEREKILSDAFSVSSDYSLEDKNVLLIDDLYRSGATLRAITGLLYNQSKVKNVFVVTLTKTRSNR